MTNKNKQTGLILTTSWRPLIRWKLMCIGVCWLLSWLRYHKSLSSGWSWFGGSWTALVMAPAGFGYLKSWWYRLVLQCWLLTSPETEMFYLSSWWLLVWWKLIGIDGCLLLLKQNMISLSSEWSWFGFAICISGWWLLQSDCVDLLEQLMTAGWIKIDV